MLVEVDEELPPVVPAPGATTAAGAAAVGTTVGVAEGPAVVGVVLGAVVDVVDVVVVGVVVEVVVVGTAAAHTGTVIVFVSSVTAAVRASSRPWRVAPVVAVMAVSARTEPIRCEPVPSVAELPTCQ